jgi:chromate reductase
MSDYLVFAASNNKNLELANNISKALEGSEVIDLVSLDLPLYTPVAEKKEIPGKARELADKLISAKGAIFVAPEYNGSLPPTLNNAIAWISRTGENWREAFNGKAAVIATHSGSGGIHVLTAMRQQLSYIGMNVVGRQLHTHYSKALSEDTLEAVIKELKKIN